jgi:hypothetical protein
MERDPQLSVSLSYSVRRLPEFTSIKISGPASLQSFAELIGALGKETRTRGDKRVLVDLLAVTGELRFTDHFQMGEQAARELQHLDKLASVVPGDKITHTSEKVALMQGLQLRVFSSMTEAIRWLGHEA